VHAIAHFYACTTHLSSTSSAVAISQCHYLMDTAIPTLRTQNRQDPLILGADLNLTDGQSPNAQSCMPARFRARRRRQARRRGERQVQSDVQHADQYARHN
jgi:hypothetical protein